MLNIYVILANESCELLTVKKVFVMLHKMLKYDTVSSFCQVWSNLHSFGFKQDRMVLTNGFYLLYSYKVFYIDWPNFRKLQMNLLVQWVHVIPITIILEMQGLTSENCVNQGTVIVLFSPRIAYYLINTIHFWTALLH